jgi:hypothetical protein
MKRSGLFEDNKARNMAMLAKWIMKLEGGDLSIFYKLLIKKYLGYGSQFWKGLHSMKYCLKRGIEYMLGDGEKVKFLEDAWT